MNRLSVDSTRRLEPVSEQPGLAASPVRSPVLEFWRLSGDEAVSITSNSCGTMKLAGVALRRRGIHLGFNDLLKSGNFSPSARLFAILTGPDSVGVCEKHLASGDDPTTELTSLLRLNWFS